MTMRPLQAAFAHHQAGDLDAAETIYRQILGDEPDHLDGLQLLGALLHQRGDATQAVDLLQRAAAVLERSSAADAAHAALHNNLGNALQAVGRMAEAAEHFRRGIALDPELAELHANLATALLEQDDLDGAIASYRSALRLGPVSIACLDRLADAYAAAGRLGDRSHLPADTPVATLALPASLRPEAWATIACLLHQESEHAAAISLCRSALDHVPGDVGVSVALAGILVDTHKAAEAAAICRLLVSAGPDARAYHVLGRALGDTGDNIGATEALRRCLELDPSQVDALLDLAAAVSKLGLDRLAVPLLEIAIEARPDDVRFHLTLANTLQTLGETARARIHYRRGSELQPLGTVKAVGTAEFAVLLILAPGVGNTPYEFLFKDSAYDRHFYALLPEIEPDIALLHRHGDVVINLIAEADQGAGVLEAAADLIDRLGKPTVNHPRNVAATTRDGVAESLAGIASCRIPATKRLARAALDAPDGLARLGAVAFPLLLRVAGTHGGVAFEKMETPDDIARFLAEHPAEAYYLSEYVDYRSADGLFRKYRFVFTDIEILPYHLAIGTHWKIHHYTTDMERHAWMQEEEKAFLANPRGVFSLAHYDALAAIRAAVGLDFFGIDCALDRDGNIVVFEVNASILIHDRNDNFPYKMPYCVAIRQALDAMLRRAAGR